MLKDLDSSNSGLIFPRRCSGFFLAELLHPFLRIFVEILHTVFAAEFHFQAFIDQRDGLAHVAADDIAGDDASCRRSLLFDRLHAALRAFVQLGLSGIKRRQWTTRSMAQDD